MGYLKNDKGIALVTALLLTLVTLAVIVGVLYLLRQQTKTSAADKVYKTALQAAYGDSEFFLKDLIPLMFPGDKNKTSLEAQFTNLSLDIVPTDACMSDKILKNTVDWTNCAPENKTIEPKKFPDATIVLKGQASDYKIYSKIIDTVRGNTDGSGAARDDRYTNASGVTGSGMELRGMRQPYLYTVEIRAEGATNPKEKAMLEVLYAY